MKTETEGEATVLPKGSVVFLNATNALLSLFTSLDPVTRAPLTTRTVIATRQSENELILLDNIHWYLYISVPAHVPPRLLKRFMIYSYCLVNYTNPKTTTATSSESTTPALAHGFYPPVCANRMISDEIKDVVYAIDTRNEARYTDWCERIRPSKRQWHNWNDDEEEVEEDDEIVEEIDETYEQMVYCAFDRDVDLVRGLYNGDYNTRRSGDEAEEEEEEEEDLLNINEELYHTYGREYVQKRLPRENQYRLVFNNHTVMHYFVSRFMRKEVEMKRENLKFSVRVLEYVADHANVRALVPVCKQYIGNTKAYIEGQMYRFKHEREVIAIRLNDDDNDEAVGLVCEGLLHPSSLESYGGQGCSYNCTHYQNVYDHMYPARHTISKQAMAFQTLYIDLSVHAGHVRLLDYRTRRDVVTPLKQLNTFLQANGLSDTTDDNMKESTPAPTLARKSSAAASTKRIRNQPQMGDFVSRHQVKLTSMTDAFEKLEAQQAATTTTTTTTTKPKTAAKSLKRKSPATPVNNRKGDTSKKKKKKRKKKQTEVGNMRDRALFFQPYSDTTKQAVAAAIHNDDGGGMLVDMMK